MFIEKCSFSSLEEVFARDEFFNNQLYDYRALRTISWAPGGGADIGECLVTIAKIKESDDEGWYAEWNQLALRLEEEAIQMEKEGLSMKVIMLRQYYDSNSDRLTIKNTGKISTNGMDSHLNYQVCGNIALTFSSSSVKPASRKLSLKA